MSDLVINEPTCSHSGLPTANREEELPLLVPPSVNEATEETAETIRQRIEEHEEAERKMIEDNLKRTGIAS